MAYSSTNQVRKIVDFGISGAGSLWSYESTHTHSAIAASNFFTGCGYGSPGAKAVGMKPGDLLVHMHVSSATSAVTWHRVNSLSTSTGFGSPIHATVSAASS